MNITLNRQKHNEAHRLGPVLRLSIYTSTLPVQSIARIVLDKARHNGSHGFVLSELIHSELATVISYQHM